jgi:preprotein translocase subunit SecA
MKLYKSKKLLNIDNLYDVTGAWIPYILNAVRAKVFYIKNKNYIVQNEKILIKIGRAHV